MSGVNFCRTMRPGMRGNDIRAAKRAISRWNPKVYKWRNFSDYYGPVLEKAVRKFQSTHGLKPTGFLDAITINKLSGAKNRDGERAYDATALELAHSFCSEYAQHELRQKIVDAGFFWYHHRASIAYSQARAYQLRKPPRIPHRWDCSAFVSNCYYAAGAKNPNGRPWDGLGYTGTLISHGTAISITQAKPGDLIFYGFSAGAPGFRRGDPTHVALYVGVVNGVPSVLSHGSYPMHFLRWDYRTINQIRRYI
jgi:hypothetical protein